MTDRSEWQKANRELIAEEQRKLGDPPTAEEMLAYTRGELSEEEEERIRDLVVAYPELARMFVEAAPEEPRPGDPDFVPQEQVLARWSELQQRLGGGAEAPAVARTEAQRGRVRFHSMPTAIAAALALVFLGLFVQAERRARHYAKESRTPRLLASPQVLIADSNRGPAGAPTTLSKDGEVYLLEPQLSDQIVYPHYRLELVDAQDEVIWTSVGEPDGHGAFQLVVPHDFLVEGRRYRLRIHGLDGKTSQLVGSYDLSVPAE